MSDYNMNSQLEYQLSFGGLWYTLWFNSLSVRGLSSVYIWLNNSRWYCTGAKIKWCTCSIMCRIIKTINFDLRGNTSKFMGALHYTTWKKVQQRKITRMLFKSMALYNDGTHEVWNCKPIWTTPKKTKYNVWTEMKKSAESLHWHLILLEVNKQEDWFMQWLRELGYTSHGGSPPPSSYGQVEPFDLLQCSCAVFLLSQLCQLLSMPLQSTSQ